MLIVWAIAAAAVLVFFGYIAILGSKQAGLSEDLAMFGKVVSVVMYVAAGLVIIFSLVQVTMNRNPITGRPVFSSPLMMQRQQGAYSYGNFQPRPNFAINQPGQQGNVNVPGVVPRPQGAGNRKTK